MAVSPKDKEHLKKLLHNHLSVEEYRKQDHCYISIAGMLAAFCAAKGKFDISVVLENFADFKKSSAYLGGLEKGDTIDWKHLIYYTAAYCFFDIPLLYHKYETLEKKLQWFFFYSACRDYPEKDLRESKVFPSIYLSENIRQSMDSGCMEELHKAIESAPSSNTALKNIVYAVLRTEKFDIFAGLYKRYDLLSAVDMEIIFDFWSKKYLLRYWKNNDKACRKEHFMSEWNDPENFPLHRLIIKWDVAGRCIPVLFRREMLYPEVLAELLKMGMPVNKPLTDFKGWENLTLPEFAKYFGEFLPDFEFDRDDNFLFSKLETAAFYQEYTVSHPLKAEKQQVTPAPAASGAGKSGSLTEEQKKRLANDEARGIIFCGNNRKLKAYPWQADTAAKYEIPDFVTAISPEAFSETDKLKHVVLSPQMKKIGRDAFSFSGIRTIEIPEGLTHVVTGAFYACESLKEVIFPDSMQEIENAAFRGCSRLKYAEIPEGCKVGATAFMETHKDLQIVYRPKKNE